MRLQRFHRLLDIHGADLARWPAEDRATAQRLLAEDPSAEAARRRARRLEACLDSFAPSVDLRAAARITRRLASLPAQRRFAAWRRPAFEWLGLAPPWPGLAALATMAMLGFLVGASNVDSLFTQAGDEDISALVFDTDATVETGQ